MSDPRLTRGFEVLSPRPEQVLRIDAAVRARLAAGTWSLGREWWDLLRARPLVNGAWVVAAALALIASTPLAAAPAIWSRISQAPPGIAVIAATQQSPSPGAGPARGVPAPPCCGQVTSAAWAGGGASEAPAAPGRTR